MITENETDCIKYSMKEDVAPVVHGKWIFHEGYCQCNKCNMLFSSDSNYCPNCGAPMTDEAVSIVMERLEALKGV